MTAPANEPAPPPPSSAAAKQRRQRQKRTALALAAILIAGGLFVLFALERLPMPLRILVGLGDVFAGLVLLVLIRQKSRD